MSYLVSAVQFVGGIFKGADEGAKKVDEWSGMKASREKIASEQKQQTQLFTDEVNRRNQAQADLEIEKKGKQKAEQEAGIQRAEQARAKALATSGPSNQGRRGTILTGPLGLTQGPGMERRSLLGA